MTKVWPRSLCVLFAMIGASTSSRAQDAKVITYDEWSAIESAKGRCERVVAWHKEKKGLIAQLGCDSIPFATNDADGDGLHHDHPPRRSTI
jgi:hypothetical protein